MIVKAKKIFLLVGITLCMAACGFMEKQDNDVKQAACPVCHYCSMAKYQKECDKYYGRNG